MLTKIEEKERAINLRKKGFSYSEILKQVPVAKSSLSLWLKSVNLSKSQKQRLTEKKIASMKRGWEKVHQMRMEKWKRISEQACKEVKGLSKKERWLIGAALYWAEGAKEKEYRSSSSFSFSNSDYKMILFFNNWINEFSGSLKNKIVYELYIHKKSNWRKSRLFWAERIGVPENKIRVYFKKHNPKRKKKYNNNKYNGLLRIALFGSVDFMRRISGWIEGIYKNCGVVQW